MTSEYPSGQTAGIAGSPGADARAAAAKCYSDLFIKSGLSQKASRRTVGVLHLWPVADKRIQLCHLVQKINDAKAEIKNTITSSYRSRSDRFNALHQACPGAMTNHLYRQITLLEKQDVKSFSTSWLQNDIVDCVVKSDLLDELGEAMEAAAEKEKFIFEKLIAHVRSTPEAELRLRRAIKLRASRNIKTAKGTSNSVAPMPVIVLQPERFKIKPIPNYDPEAKRRKSRSDKAVSTKLGTFAGKIIERVTS